MFSRKRIVSGLAASLAGVALLTASVRGDESKVSHGEFEQLWKIFQPLNEPWATVTWHSSLTEARTKAQKEKKPLLIRCSYGTLHGVC
jgi:glucose-6-phosphate 1-dehydrogenase